MTAPRFICIAGPMGSGKSTLALGLSHLLSIKYLPESKPGIEYLNDLFHDPARWAFEAQLAFLCHKATQLSDSITLKQNIIVDRSLDEDVGIYAEYFHERKYIDGRAYRTYMALADYFRTVIPIPDMIIYCSSSLDTLRRRIESRARPSDLNYPADHVHDIYDLYQQWITAYKAGFLYIIDGDRHDWRQGSVLGAIASEVLDNLHGASHPGRQMHLFEAQRDAREEAHEPILKLFNEPSQAIQNSLANRLDLVSQRVRSAPKYPVAYIAAPFTGRAVIKKDKSRMALPCFFSLLGADYEWHCRVFSVCWAQTIPSDMERMVLF